MGSRNLAIQKNIYLELIQIHKSMRLSRDLRPATSIFVILCSDNLQVNKISKTSEYYSSKQFKPLKYE